MTGKFRSRKSIIIALVICTILYIALQIVMIVADQKGMMMYNGVLLAIQFAICLHMVCADRRKGFIIALILMIFSLFFLLRALIFAGMTTPLPGVFNSCVYFVTLFVLYQQFKKIEHDTVTDILTELYNRRGLYNILKKRIESGKEFNVIYIDINNFKFINDKFGHIYGDRLLTTEADRIREAINGQGEAARLGSQEFVVVLDGDNNPGEFAAKLIDSICEKVTCDLGGTQIECYPDAKAGISCFPNDSENYEDLIKYADMAIYQASNDNSTKVRFFDASMANSLNRTIELETIVKEALKNDYFYLVYQPQYRIEGKVLRGFEALLRLKTPDGTFVSPGEFIPVAELSELALKIDDYVILRAMKEFKDVVEKRPELIISVNVSARNIGKEGFYKIIDKYLEITGFPAKNLEIEITEYCLVNSIDITIENIRKLREKGVQVALDDFGTGYTSLAYLSKMPIDLLKIDKSLIDDIEKDEKSNDFVKAVISIGHLMGCEVISEGVETEGQVKSLGEQDCDYIQGYVWGKPLDYEKALELV